MWKCERCKKTVFAFDAKVMIKDQFWHKECFKCVGCSVLLNVANPNSYASCDGTPYCKTHYREMQLFRCASVTQTFPGVLKMTEVILESLSESTKPDSGKRKSSISPSISSLQLVDNQDPEQFTGESLIDKLPLDIYYQICFHLSVKDISALETCNKSLCKILRSDNQIWFQKFLIFQYGEDNENMMISPEKLPQTPIYPLHHVNLLIPFTVSKILRDGISNWRDELLRQYRAERFAKVMVKIGDPKVYEFKIDLEDSVEQIKAKICRQMKLFFHAPFSLTINYERLEKTKPLTLRDRKRMRTGSILELST